MLAVVAISLVVVVAACATLVFRRRRRAKETAAATVGKPGVPVIFVDELDGEPREAAEDSDDDGPVPALPPEYGTAATSPAAAGDYKLLMASSESSDNEDDDVELSRERHQPTDCVRRRHDHPQRQQRQQGVQSSSASYDGTPMGPTLAYAERR